MITLFQNTMTRSLEDIQTYEKQALDLLSEDHPHYDEIKQLLTEQIEDEVWEHANSRPN